VFAARSLVEFVVHQEDQKAERRQNYVAGRFRRDPTELDHLDHITSLIDTSAPARPPLQHPIQHHATDQPQRFGLRASPAPPGRHVRGSSRTCPALRSVETSIYAHTTHTQNRVARTIGLQLHINTASSSHRLLRGLQRVEEAGGRRGGTK